MSTITEGRTLHRARLYDFGSALMGHRLRALDRRVLACAAIASGARVLDVGCGPGRLTLAAAQIAGSNGETIGIDASPEMIERAKQKAARASSPASFRVAAVESLPFGDHHFDVALASLMMHHLPPQLQKQAVAEIFRVLKPNGRFVIVDFRAEPSHGIGHVLAMLGLRRGRQHAEHLRALLDEAGFTAVDIQPSDSRAFSIVHGRRAARK